MLLVTTIINQHQLSVPLVRGTVARPVGLVEHRQEHALATMARARIVVREIGKLTEALIQAKREDKGRGSEEWRRMLQRCNGCTIRGPALCETALCPRRLLTQVGGVPVWCRLPVGK